MTQDVLKNSNIAQAIPLKRVGQVEDVANLTYFLINATYVTGQVRC